MSVQEQALALINEWGKRKRPFFFWVSYDGQRVLLSPDDAPLPGLSYSLPFASFISADAASPLWPDKPFFHPVPPDKGAYLEAFEKVHDHLMRGDSYLLNLTFPTHIESNLKPEHFFERAQAPYKAHYQHDGEDFVCFSPEAFIRIRGNTITTNPMKGTIAADSPDAEQRLLSNEKEAREHASIVDLMRNDLSRVSRRVRVARYRYVERISIPRGDILQTSSEICGELHSDWSSSLGNILFSLLPAGSITGTPKESTCRIIREAETYDRGFYTGVFGHFSRSGLTSAVAIRFLERQHGELIYKSGGGITTMSNPDDEYEELLQKVYAPFVL